MTEKKNVRFLYYIIMLAVPVFFILLADLAASYIVPTKPFQSKPKEAYFEFDPMLMWRLIPSFSNQDIHISAQGFRSDELVDTNKKIIVLIGGSTVFGLGVQQDQTVAYYLQNLLDMHAPGAYQIINAGVTGYYSTQELMHVAMDVLQYKPEKVIALTGRNDSFYSLHPNYMANKIPYHGQIREALQALDPYYQSPGGGIEPSMHLLRFLASKANQLASNWDREWSVQGLQGAPGALSVFMDNQKALKGMLHQAGIDYELFLQPTVTYPERELHPSEQPMTDVPYYPALVDAYKQLHGKAGESLDGHWYHGIMQLPPSSVPMFIDNVHFSSDGSKVAAELIFAKVFKDVAANPAAMSLPVMYDFTAPPRYEVGLSGWNIWEQTFRWTTGRSSVMLQQPASDRQHHLVVTGHGGAVPATVNVIMDGKTIKEFPVIAEQPFEISIPMVAARQAVARKVELMIKNPWVPKALGINADTRELGVAVHTLGFSQKD